MFNYKPLWKMLVDKELNKAKLAKITGISATVIARMSKNQYVDMSSLDKICNKLNCSINDIVEHTKD